MDRHVSVTGASGFLGRRLAPALARRGWRVRILARRPLAEGFFGSESVSTVIGDLADGDAVARLTDGASVVIHAAGLIKARDREAFFEVNATGSRDIARAAAAAKARMILVSSLAAREPRLSDYAASKRAGEEVAREILGGRLISLRPPAIYGPGDRATLGLFQLAAFSPVLPVPAAPAARLALCFVDDVVGRICDLAESERSGGTFALGGAQPSGYGWREIMDTAAAAMGRRPLSVPLPLGLIRAAGGVSEIYGRLSGRPVIFTSGKAREIAHADWSVSSVEAGPMADSLMATDLGAGFARTVDWYRAQGWL